MEKIRVIIDRAANTLHVWFDDPASEYISEETGEEIILVKNEAGKVIGFEKINYFPASEIKIPAIEAEIV